MKCRAKQNISDENILEWHVGEKVSIEDPVETQTNVK